MKWIITKAVALVKAVGKLLGFGKEEDKDKEKEPGHPVYDAVKQALAEKLGEAEDPEHIHSVAANVLAQFQPQGLQKLDVVEDKETGALSIVAAASPPKTLRGYAPENRDVFMRVKISVKKPVTQAGLQHVARSRSYDPATGQMVEDPIAMIGQADRRSTAGGALEVVPGGMQINVLTWNTGDKAKYASARDDNSSHAEHLFAGWLERQEFKQSIESIVVEMSSGSKEPKDSPCPLCAADLRHVTLITPGATRALTYTAVYYSGSVTEDESWAARQKLEGDGGWDIKGPPPSGKGKKFHETKGE